MIAAIGSNESGFRPCLVFERGDETLSEFMQNTLPSIFVKMDVLLKVSLLSPLPADLFAQVLVTDLDPGDG